MKQLGFGIIGCGVISDWHARSVQAIDGAELIGAADLNEAARKSFAERYGIRAFDSIEDLLACPEISVVSICVPSGLHAPLAIQAANAGKNIIVEKPMALTVSEADEVIAACEKNGVKVAVISQIRFTEAIRVLKKAINDGTFGRIVTGDVFMRYYRSPEYYASSAWRGTYKMDGGGALMNQGIHGIDCLQYVMGDIKSVMASAKTLVHNIEVEDTCSAVVEYANGAIGVIQGTTSVFPGYPRILQISGSKGSATLEEDSILRWDTVDGKVPEGIILGRTKASGASDPKAIGIEGHKLQIEDMYHAVLENRKPLVDMYEGRKPVKIITAIYESERTGKKIYLDEFEQSQSKK